MYIKVLNKFYKLKIFINYQDNNVDNNINLLK